HLTKALERVLLRRPAGSECGAGFGYVEVAPGGEIHACHKGAGGAIGHVDSGLSERLRAPWRENRWYMREGCARCWARNVCGGGCRAESVEHELVTTRPWAVACRAKRLQIRAALHVAATAAPDALRGLLRVKQRATAAPTSTSATEGTEVTGDRGTRTDSDETWNRNMSPSLPSDVLRVLRDLRGPYGRVARIARCAT
ncbi:MAG: SPASM domain-containing protein, partial [Planctomycetota bacterium]